MINLLHIKNVGIIDDLEFNLNNGFNILTGETGAGKTLIIDSLKMLSGGRFSKEMIRRGQNFSYVEASLSLMENEDDIIVSREVNSNGKNICKINGRLVAVNELRDFMKKVIDIHGQNDNQAIFDIGTHIELLDGYAKNEIKEIKEEYSLRYIEYTKIKKELSLNYGDDLEKQRKLDLLQYQYDEIEDSHLEIGEEKSLQEKRKIIMASEKIANSVQEAQNEIENNSIDGLNNAIRAMEKIEQYNSKFVEIVSRLKSSYYEIQEASRDLSNQDVCFDEEEKNEIEERLNLINNLKRKYGNSIEEILEYKNKVENEICTINNMECYIAELKNKLNQIQNEMIELSYKMNEIRVKSAKELSLRITNELKDLEMKSAEFWINVELLCDNKFNENGLNKVEFLISTNIGEDKKELTKIASGGEMSRMMLAIKKILSDVDQIPVLVFDEIDTGISGKTASITGEKMKSISQNHQVICITHLANIAAKGDFNYYIYKENVGECTKSFIISLNEEETIREIARISNGEITDISIQNAKEMRRISKQIA